MKKIALAIFGLLAFAAAPAAAADLTPVYKAAPPPVANPWTWNGLYVGGNVGYSLGHSDTTDTLSNAVTGLVIVGGTSSASMNGAIGGGQLGYNMQWATWVLGVETDIQGSGQDGSSSLVCLACNAALTFGPGLGQPAIATLNQKLVWFGTVRGRLGTTFVSPTILLYVTGGLAYGEIDNSGAISGFTGQSIASSVAFSLNTTRAGWTIGAGVEGRVIGNWTAKAEYLHIDLGSIIGATTNTALVTPLAFNFTSHITDDILRLGFNYKFTE